MKRWILAAIVCTRLCAFVCPHVEVGGGYLWWKPISSDFDYAETLGGRVETLQPNYRWGWTVYARALTPSRKHYIEGGYLRYDTSAAKKVKTIHVPLISPDQTFMQAKVKEDIYYETAYGHVGRNLFRCLLFHLDAFGGVRYLQLSERRQIFADQQRYQLRTQFSGAGVEVGLGARSCSLFGCSARIRGAGAMVVGRRTTPSQGNSTFEVETEGQIRVLPYIKAEAGVGYRPLLLPFVIVDLEVGYRLDYVWDFRMNNQIVDPAGVAPRLRTIDSDIGFGGPYITLTVGF